MLFIWCNNPPSKICSRRKKKKKKKKWPTLNRPRQLVAKTWLFFLQSVHALHPVVRFTLQWVVSYYSHWLHEEELSPSCLFPEVSTLFPDYLIPLDKTKVEKKKSNKPVFPLHCIALKTYIMLRVAYRVLFFFFFFFCCCCTTTLVFIFHFSFSQMYSLQRTLLLKFFKTCWKKHPIY